MAGKKNKIELNDFLNKVVTKIVSNLDIDEILLFGSYARGQETDCSDIDVAVVSPEFDSEKSMYSNAMKIYDKTDLLEPYLQLVPLASDRFYNETFVDPGFIQSIKATGKKIYSREQGISL